MRVCQPSPPDLKKSKTSGLYRTLTNCLVGASCGPRCPGLRLAATAALTAAYPPPRATTALDQAALSFAVGLRSLPGALATTASHSAGLAGNFFDVAPDFMLPCLSKIDDVKVIFALSVGHDHYLTVKPASRPESKFSVCDARIFVYNYRTIRFFSPCARSRSRMCAGETVCGVHDRRIWRAARRSAQGALADPFPPAAACCRSSVPGRIRC